MGKLCSHGVNPANRVCGECQMQEYELSTHLPPARRTSSGRPKMASGKKYVTIIMEVTDNQLQHVRSHLRQVQIPFTIKEG